MKILKQIVDFFLCFLREDCEFSIKKLLAYVFSTVAIYIILFTDKDYYNILGFVGILLGIRAYERYRSPSPSGTGGDLNDPSGDFTVGKRKRMD